MLDIILTHYNEPEKVWRKFFIMLSLQRGIDFSSIRVIVIHDGTDLFPKQDMPFQIEQYQIEHGGVSAARNEGIRRSAADWIMFCDCDDMFSNVFSLRDYLTILPTDKYDILRVDFIAEDQNKSGETILNLRHEDIVFVHGKLYRRQFLLENNLWFDTTLEFNEDSLFNAVAIAVTDRDRIGEIRSKYPLYIWCYNPGSLTATRENRWKALYGLWQRNRKLCSVFKEKLPYERYCGMVARTCIDAYFCLCLKNTPDELIPMREEFKEFYRENRNAMWNTDVSTLKQIKSISKAEHERGDEEELLRWGEPSPLKTDATVPVSEWLESIYREATLSA